jgi:hypothetical protein
VDTLAMEEESVLGRDEMKDQVDRLAKEMGYLVVEAERISNKAKQDTTSSKERTSVSLRI